MSRRMRATAIHLAGSSAVAALAWLLVSFVWYPSPLAELAGGAALFAILVSVDVVIGPALTAVVASPSKARTELVRDLSVILLLQLCAFGYGMYTVAAARPVAIAFEVDLFRVVTAAEVDVESLPKAPPSLRQLSWRGPATLAAVKPANSVEQLRTIELGLAGIALAALPEHWREYAQESGRAWTAAKPVSTLVAQHANAAPDVNRIAARAGVPAAELRFLPLLARRAEGVVLVAPPNARVAGVLPFAATP